MSEIKNELIENDITSVSSMLESLVSDSYFKLSHSKWQIMKDSASVLLCKFRKYFSNSVIAAARQQR